jgi:glycosyltransferase involved in cell wall biosynthesis
MDADIVPNIVDLDLFHPGAPAKPPQIIVARNLEPIYDNATALRAFAIVRASMPQARLLIAGTGPEADRLQVLARDLGVDGAVEFAGRLERETMARRLRESSVALNPSRVDNMPNSVLEALASGVPVVSTRVGGVPCIVEHEQTALLVSPEDPKEMAAAILAVLRDTALAQRLRSSGLERVGDYTWQAVRPRWSSVYRSVCAPSVSG